MLKLYVRIDEKVISRFSNRTQNGSLVKAGIRDRFEKLKREFISSLVLSNDERKNSRFSSIFKLLLIFALQAFATDAGAQKYLQSATEIDSKAAQFLEQTRLQRAQFSRQQAPLFDVPATTALQSNNLTTLWIPVQIHIAQNGQYYQAIDFLALSYLLSEVNAGLRDANIQLYSCGSANIIDDP